MPSSAGRGSAERDLVVRLREASVRDLEAQVAEPPTVGDPWHRLTVDRHRPQRRRPPSFDARLVELPVDGVEVGTAVAEPHEDGRVVGPPVALWAPEQRVDVGAEHSAGEHDGDSGRRTRPARRRRPGPSGGTDPRARAPGRADRGGLARGSGELVVDDDGPDAAAATHRTARSSITASDPRRASATSTGTSKPSGAMARALPNGPSPDTSHPTSTAPSSPATTATPCGDRERSGPGGSRTRPGNATRRPRASGGAPTARPGARRARRWTPPLPTRRCATPRWRATAPGRSARARPPQRWGSRGSPHRRNEAPRARPRSRPGRLAVRSSTTRRAAASSSVWIEK